MIPTVVQFSGGRSSAYMLIRMVKEGWPIDLISFQNTGKELEETLQFVKQVGEYIQREIVWIEYRDNEAGFEVVNFDTASRNGEPFAAIIAKRNFLPNVMARFCTQELKIRPLKKYLMALGWEHWTAMLGIRYDEPLRWGKIIQNTQRERWTNDMPMVEWETAKSDVMTFWAAMPFDLQLAQHEGNCDMCFLKGKRKAIQILRDRPQTANWWSAIEKKYGATFRKEISTAQLLEKAKAPLLFDEYDIDYPCFCNAD
jgi:3'-phosphoadenosine 5'-phosphosulfate sulfotransferase (PAPS reductase)/FAD synthetase